MQPCLTPFPILNQSDVPCPALFLLDPHQVSQETIKLVWYFHLFKNFPQFAVIHTVKSFSVVNEADVFLEFLCFLYDPVNIRNLVSSSCAFSKFSLYIWNFSVHVLMKPSLKNFKHILTSMQNVQLLEHSLALPFYGIGIKTDFSAEFSKFADILISTTHSCECPGVSGGGVGQQWPASGSGALSSAVPAWDLLKEVTIIFTVSSIVWSQVKQQGGNTAIPINSKLDEWFTEHGTAHQNNTQFLPQSVSLIRKLP